MKPIGRRLPRHAWTLIFPATLAILSACNHDKPAADSPRQEGSVRGEPSLPPGEVRVEAGRGRNARQYTLRTGDCRLSWTISDPEPDRGVILNRSLCGTSLQDQMPALSRILEAVMRDSAAAEMPLRFIWGRLYPDEPCDQYEMSFRLALAAHRSSDWDGQRGRPRSSDENTYTARIANQEMIYPELKELFGARGLKLRLAFVEKVLILPAGQLRIFRRLEAAGVSAKEKLPFDCLAYFSVSK